jgi:hypothetical protein
MSRYVGQRYVGYVGIFFSNIPVADSTHLYEASHVFLVGTTCRSGGGAMSSSNVETSPRDAALCADWAFIALMSDLVYRFHNIMYCDGHGVISSQV